MFEDFFQLQNISDRSRIWSIVDLSIVNNQGEVSNILGYGGIFLGLNLSFECTDCSWFLDNFVIIG